MQVCVYLCWKRKAKLRSGILQELEARYILKYVFSEAGCNGIQHIGVFAEAYCVRMPHRRVVAKGGARPKIKEKQGKNG